jgi:N-acetylglucosaminyldiphosphoundecaprenol N-acetyl-beta-D-mannosaminyltransferase
MNIMNYEVFTDELNTLDLSKRQIINTINPHSYVTAKSDKLFTTALKESDLLIADGSGIVMAAKHINKETIKKIAGTDLHKFLLEEMDKKGGQVFYMGAAPKTLEKIETKIKKEYPNIKVSSYSPPFKPEFNDEENQEIIQKVNEFQPDVLFIGMTAPKQEKWLHTHKDKLEFTIASSIGAVFDFYAGNVQRSSQFWIDMHLEWLPRLLQEPKRLWRRNFVSTPLFLLDMFLFKFGIKK